MKKYIQPNTDKIFVKAQPLMAGTVIVDDENPITDPGEFLAPKWSLFDDEDDEEEVVY